MKVWDSHRCFTVVRLMKLDQKVIDGLALCAHLAQVDSSTGKRRTADVVSILLLFGVQGIEMRLDSQRDNSGRVVGEVLLQRRRVHFVLVQSGGGIREQSREIARR